MAKWGEGDPRWIVEQRPDGTNPNNWHWTEKNATPWSKDRLKLLLEGLEVVSPEASCKITKLKECEGEATANNRKGKLIFFYEWDIKCKWQGSLAGSTDKFDGTLEVPNLSDENGPEDLDVNVSAKSTEEDAVKLKEFMRKNCLKPIRERLGQYIQELKEEFSQGLILPTKDLAGKFDGGPINQIPPVEILKLSVPSDSAACTAGSSNGVPLQTKRLTLKEEFKCTAQDLYRAFTIPELVKAFTNGSSTLDPTTGGRFSLFGGTVDGSFLELNPFDKIKMHWRLKNYPSGHYSLVTLDFIDKGDCTELHLNQADVPQAEFEKTEFGWKRHYFEAMKVTFGFGARLM